ncbi:MAG: ABC transporter permease [Schleiferiaceae bacterium]|nr:ABC transporter permease [Schleiferiaceae bacterium]MDG1313808.1 ABC transporter permease [Schleiferiaceae bacterium]MDG1918269.1 ABC transporter permease [Schleiferiaceae bacterium]MDG2110523.1 ABC transporter permease [Schleiferiaceae bacterium]
MKEAFFIARKIQKSTGSQVIGPLLKLSIVATALGMALVLLSITSGKGLQHAIMDKFSALEGDFTISAYAPNRTEELNPISLTDSLADALQEAPYIKSVYPVVQKMALLVNPIEDAFDGIQIKGMDTDYLETFSAQYGNGNGSSSPASRYGTLLSTTLARELGLGIGDTAVLTVLKNQGELPRLRKSMVEGLFTTGLDEFDRQTILMKQADVARLNGWRGDSVSSYMVVLNDQEGREIISSYWNAVIPYTMQARSIEDRHPAIFGWLALFDTNIILVLAIVLIVAVANLITALLVLIIDRTRMIGTLKALGGSDRLILQVFQWLSIRILTRGLAWGNALGLGLSFIQWQFSWVQLDPETYYIATAPITFDWAWILGANAVFIVIAYLILLLPVRWIARLHPIQSIRFS